MQQALTKETQTQVFSLDSYSVILMLRGMHIRFRHGTNVGWTSQLDRTQLNPKKAHLNLRLILRPTLSRQKRQKKKQR
jgi:hypothetical protein